MKKNGKILGDLLPVITIAVLFVVILLLVVFSAVSYQGAVEHQDGSGNTRAVLSYVITAVKANETSQVSIEEEDGMNVLEIADPETGYAQQIFFRDGSVYESYAKTGTVPDPEDALEIGTAERFDMSWYTEDLLEIQTDLGSSFVHVRTQ